MAAVGIRVGVVAVGALALSLAFGWARLVPLSLVALGGMYALQLAIDDEPLDASAPLVAAGDPRRPPRSSLSPPRRAPAAPDRPYYRREITRR